MIRAEKILFIESASLFTREFCRTNDIYTDDVSLSWDGPGKYAITTSSQLCRKGCCSELVAFATHIDKYKQQLTKYISDLEAELNLLQ